MRKIAKHCSRLASEAEFPPIFRPTQGPTLRQRHLVNLFLMAFSWPESTLSDQFVQHFHDQKTIPRFFKYIQIPPKKGRRMAAETQFYIISMGTRGSRHVTSCTVTMYPERLHVSSWCEIPSSQLYQSAPPQHRQKKHPISSNYIVVVAYSHHKYP